MHIGDTRQEGSRGTHTSVSSDASGYHNGVLFFQNNFLLYCSFRRIYTYLDVYIHICMFPRMPPDTTMGSIFFSTYIYTYTHMYICIYVYIYICVRSLGCFRIPQWGPFFCSFVLSVHTHTLTHTHTHTHTHRVISGSRATERRRIVFRLTMRSVYVSVSLSVSVSVPVCICLSLCTCVYLWRGGGSFSTEYEVCVYVRLSVCC
jgi:hypothetical protein